MKLEWVLSSSALILVVLALRAALGSRISARLRYALWAAVLLRLLVPVQLYASPLAGMSVSAPQAPAVLQEKSIYVLPVSSVPAEESDVRFGEDGTPEPFGDPGSFGYPRLEDGGEMVVRYADRVSPADILLFVWGAGAAALGLILLGSNLRFARRLRRTRRPVEAGGCPLPVYQAAGLPSPCLFGLLRPAVYVTEAAAENPEMLRHVLAHELTHYRHLDHLWSISRGIALALHWWNPLVWLAVVLSRRDSELACDEGALRRLGDGERTAYGETLLSLVTAKAGPWDLLRCATTMTGEKKNLTERIRRIASRQKVLVSASVLAVLAVLVFAVTAFGQKDSTPQMATLEGEYQLDIDRDGELETAWVQEKDTEPIEWTLDIVKGDYMQEDVSSIWSVTLDESYGNCGIYFLYREDGLDYLLEYIPKRLNFEPYVYNYSYRLFHLENGEEVTDRENSVDFDINFDAESHRHFDPAEIAAFMDEVNGLMGESTLLMRVNTSNWMVRLRETEDGRLYDDMASALYPNGDGGMPLQEALERYAEEMEKRTLALNDLLTGLTPSDIGDISGQDAVTAAQLTELLRGALDHRNSQYIPYDFFAGHQAWKSSVAGWAVPLTNGGTLYLLAGDYSGRVEIAYEMEMGCTSASFYPMEELYELITKIGEPYPVEVLPYDIDLDWDGKPDQLTLRSNRERDPDAWELKYHGSADMNWSVSLRGDCGAYFLCREDGRDYLLEYTPRMEQGICDYSYRLFHFEGKEIITDRENSVSFDLTFSSQHHAMDPEAIADFMWEVNGLIGESRLLVNTNRQMLNLEETEDGKLRDNILVSLQYKGSGDYSTRAELTAALEDYASYAADHPDDIYAPLGSSLSELEASEIGDISGQTAVTVSELAELIREAALHRTSRFHEYDTFQEEESWIWTKAAWAVPLTDGGTLHLIACGSGSVEIAYETGEGAASAYYTSAELYNLICEIGEDFPVEDLPYEADLDHDGEPDKLTLKEGPDGMSWSLQCRTDNNRNFNFWNAYTPHVGWNALFLCQMDGKDYLLRYNPYMSTGLCEYSYRLFYLREGTEVVVQENAIEFDLIFSPDYAASHQFDPQAIAAFMEEVNALLANSTQLLNTDENLLGTFEKEGRLYDSLWWLEAEEDGFVRDDSKSLLENLTAFQANAQRVSQNSAR